jgi:NAD(P)-dependent dehydrogenase (short-subunit alcohol dehydrogenase family)
MKRLENKIVAITGAGGGIGRVAADIFAKEGATVCILELKADAADKAAAEITAAGGKAFAYPVDISDCEAVKAVFEQIDADHGGLDVLYNNASGTTGTVSLAASAANYSILEIFYTDGTRMMSQRVYAPNGRTTILQRSVFSSTSAFYDGSAIVSISGASITWSNQGRLVIGTGSSQTVEADTSTLKIAYVLGWK